MNPIYVATTAQEVSGVSYRYAKGADVRIFYREAGLEADPTIVLLHGFYRSEIAACNNAFNRKLAK